jgi:hypothetical protein
MVENIFYILYVPFCLLCGFLIGRAARRRGCGFWGWIVWSALFSPILPFIFYMLFINWRFRLDTPPDLSLIDEEFNPPARTANDAKGEEETSVEPDGYQKKPAKGVGAFLDAPSNTDSSPTAGKKTSRHFCRSGRQRTD